MRIVAFRLKSHVQPLLRGELCYMRVDAILCLFPDHHQIRTIENGWTVEVDEKDWGNVETAFREYYQYYQDPSLAGREDER